jgi:U6 snRNA-associated Sm-like protein LSm1
VLQSTVERVFIPPPSPSSQADPSTPTQPGLYADIPRGIFLVRGENVLLLGEIDLDKDDDPPPGYEKAEAEVVHKLAKERKIKEFRIEKFRLGKLKELGFEGENTGEALI